MATFAIRESFPTRVALFEYKFARDQVSQMNNTDIATRAIQNGCSFAVDIFKYTFAYEHCYTWIRILLQFVVKGPVNNKPALVQVMP